MAEKTLNDITALTVQLLSAYVSRNTVPSEALANLIKTTRSALMDSPSAAVEEKATESFTPAVSVRKSLASPDHIISLIDGKPYKTLKRHLASHGLTPEQYRERYKLPTAYPLVAQSYSDARRAVARKLGLGKNPALLSSAFLSDDAATAPPAESEDKAAKQKAAKKTVATTPKTAKAGSKSSAVAATDTPALETATTATSSAPKGAGRNRLSIAGPKEKSGSSSETAAPVSAKPAGKKTTSAPKAKTASKSKSFKAALEGANSHLGAGEKPSEASSA